MRNEGPSFDIPRGELPLWCEALSRLNDEASVYGLGLWALELCGQQASDGTDPTVVLRLVESSGEPVDSETALVAVRMLELSVRIATLKASQA